MLHDVDVQTFSCFFFRGDDVSHLILNLFCASIIAEFLFSYVYFSCFLYFVVFFLLFIDLLLFLGGGNLPISSATIKDVEETTELS